MTTELPTQIANGGAGLIPHSEHEAAKWAGLSAEALVGLVGNHGNAIVRDGASAEMSRRSAKALSEFKQEAAQQASRMIALANETSQQTTVLIRLTKWIVGLTVVLGILTALLVVKELGLLPAAWSHGA